MRWGTITSLLRINGRNDIHERKTRKRKKPREKGREKKEEKHNSKTHPPSPPFLQLNNTTDHKPRQPPHLRLRTPLRPPQAPDIRNRHDRRIRRPQHANAPLQPLMPRFLIAIPPSLTHSLHKRERREVELRPRLLSLGPRPRRRRPRAYAGRRGQARGSLTIGAECGRWRWRIRDRWRSSSWGLIRRGTQWSWWRRLSLFGEGGGRASLLRMRGPSSARVSVGLDGPVGDGCGGVVVVVVVGRAVRREFCGCWRTWCCCGGHGAWRGVVRRDGATMAMGVWRSRDLRIRWWGRWSWRRSDDGETKWEAEDRCGRP